MAALKNIFSILFCVVILSQAQAVEPIPGIDSRLSQGKAPDVLRCRIEASRKRFLVDNPISFRITFENIGKKTIHLGGVGQSRIYEAGDFYFNGQKVEAMPLMHIDSGIRPLVSLNPDQSKVVLFTLSQWGI